MRLNLFTLIVTSTFCLPGLGCGPVPAGNQTVHPGESIQARLDLLSPGDTLFIAKGTYVATFELPGNGEAGRPIVVRNVENEAVTIANRERFLVLDADYWIFEGLTFDHQGGATDAIKIKGSNNIIRNCTLRNGRRDAIDVAGGAGTLIENNTIHNFVWQRGKDAHGIVVVPGTLDLTIRGNTIYDCGGDCVQLYAVNKTPIADYSRRIIIEDNQFYTTLGADSENALDFKGVDTVVVRRNEMYGFDNKAVVVQKGCRNMTFLENRIHDSDRGVEFRGEGGYWQENVTFRRNTIYHIAGYALKFDRVVSATIFNNTLSEVAGNAIRFEGLGLQDGRIHNNIIFRAKAPDLKGSFEGDASHNGWFQADCGGLCGTGDVIHPDPGFVSLPSNDYRLRHSSIAIDRGIDLGRPAQKGAPDLGAFEYGR